MSYTIVRADARHIPLADKSVHCVVTSPPFFGLRDYGVDGQIGLERSVDLYMGQLMTVFQEVWRVLRDDGTCWVEIGDSYAGSWGGYSDIKSDIKRGQGNSYARPAYNDLLFVPPTATAPGIKPKNKILIPFRFAIAMQDAGWYVRQDIIWHHINCMPESVRDRCTTAHSYIFLLTKSERYYYDAEAIKELTTGTVHDRGAGNNPKAHTPGANSRIFIDRDVQHSSRPIKQNAGFSEAITAHILMRNKRSVWAIPSEPSSRDHYAAFPTEIPRLCMLAGTSAKGVCSQCGKQYVRIVERKRYGHWHSHSKNLEKGNRIEQDAIRNKNYIPPQTIDWQPSCQCQNAGSVLPVVLDPFSGSGTTVLVADRMGRYGIGLDLSTKYCDMAQARCLEDTPLFASMPHIQETEQPSLFGEESSNGH